jgi:hypothetical protein
MGAREVGRRDGCSFGSLGFDVVSLDALRYVTLRLPINCRRRNNVFVLAAGWPKMTCLIGFRPGCPVGMLEDYG